MIKDNEQVGTWKDAVVAHFEVLPRCSLERWKTRNSRSG